MLAPLFFACWMAQAPAAAIPPNDGWVTDLAPVLSKGEEGALEEELATYARRTGHELSILTLPNLGGRPIEQLALEVGRAWKIGREGQNDGALLVVAKAEHQVRVEVGRGLEGTLTDSVCGRIIRDVIVPRFRSREFYAGLSAGLKAMEAAISGEPLPAQPDGRRRGAPIGTILFFILIFAIAASNLRARRRGLLARTLGGPVIFPGSFGGRSFGGGSSHGGFGGFGGGGGFSGGGASGRW